MQGQEVMRIMKKTHAWGWNGPEFHGMRSDGVEVWYMKLKVSMTGTDYRKLRRPTNALEE